MKQSIGLLRWLAQYCYTGITETFQSSTFICSNGKGHNGEVFKIQMIKIRTKWSTESLFYNYFVFS